MLIVVIPSEARDLQFSGNDRLQIPCRYRFLRNIKT